MQSLVVASGSCQSGDVLLLASDGVAAWYLQQLENNDRKPDDLLKTKQNEELGQFFNDERATGRMRNDDVGVVRIEIIQRRKHLKE